MPRQSRVLTPPADHAFRISWDLSRDTPVNSPTTLNSYLNADNPLIPQEQEITNLCQWSIGLARGIMEVLLHLRPYEQLRRWLVPPLYQRLVTIIDRDPRSFRREPCHPIQWHISQTSATVIESCVIIAQGEGRHVISMRLQTFKNRWIVTPLDVLYGDNKKPVAACTAWCMPPQTISHSGRSALLTLLCRATLSTIGSLCC